MVFTFPSEVWNNPNWKFNVCIILWRLKRTATKAFSVRRTFFLTVFAKTDLWFIEGCLHFCNNMNYRFVVLNRTNMWRVNLKQWCQCGVHVFKCLLYTVYRSICFLFPISVVLIQFSVEVSRALKMIKEPVFFIVGERLAETNAGGASSDLSSTPLTKNLKPIAVFIC